MNAATTESSNDRSAGIDQRVPIDALALLLDGQIAAATSVREALPAIAEMAQAMAQTIKTGGRLLHNVIRRSVPFHLTLLKKERPSCTIIFGY